MTEEKTYPRSLGLEEFLAEVEARDLKDADISALIGCTTQFVSRMRRSKRRPGRDTMVKIEEVFDVPVSHWFAPAADQKAA
jgi:transcriptional regulator with XRE-family HTH domain